MLLVQIIYVPQNVLFFACYHLPHFGIHLSPYLAELRRFNFPNKRKNNKNQIISNGKNVSDLYDPDAFAHGNVVAVS